MSTAQTARAGYVGRPVERREDVRFLRGEGIYLDDIEPEGVAHLAVVRSTQAHARIATVSSERAVVAPGVHAVLTATDLDGRVSPVPRREFPGVTTAGVPHPVLAKDRVRYVGQPVAAVVANSRAQAEDAAELVDIEYEPLDVVLDPRTAATAATRLHEWLPDNVLMRLNTGAGDVAGAFSRAKHRVSGRIHIPRVAAAPLETRGAIAQYDSDADVLTVWCSAQGPHRPRAELAHMLRRPEERIRVVVPDVGGAFGSKGAAPVEAAIAALAAMDLGRPVKWTEDRLENFVGAHQGRCLDADVELALDGNGRVLALRAELFVDMGAYLYVSTPIAGQTAASLLTGPYAIEAADVHLLGVATNKVPTGPYRGAGRPEAALLLERMMDIAATEVGIDRIELRRRNLIGRDGFPHTTPLGLTYDSGDYRAQLDRVLEKADIEALRARRAGARAEGRLFGFGLAMYVERAGGGWESAEVTVRPDGGVVVGTGSSPHGQGHETTFAQVVADELGVGMEDVTIRWGDTDLVPPGTGTFGSRSMTMGGSAVLLAASRIKQQAELLAAHLLGVERNALLWKDDRVRVRDDERGLTLAELAAHCHDDGRVPEPLRHGLHSRERFEAPFVFSAGVHLAVVEVERSTGRLRVERLVAVDDVGRVVNPLVAEGQVIGGSAQGLGEALVEELVHDESGQQVTSSFADYGLLTAADMPPVDAEFLETYSPHNPLGIKGVGEGGAIGAPAAVANAVADALAPLGVRHVDLPFTAEKLWRLVAEAERPAPGVRGRAEPVEAICVRARGVRLAVLAGAAVTLAVAAVILRRVLARGAR